MLDRRRGARPILISHLEMFLPPVDYLREGPQARQPRPTGRCRADLERECGCAAVDIVRSAAERPHSRASAGRSVGRSRTFPRDPGRISRAVAPSPLPATTTRVRDFGC